ncbi:hypothetical protein L3X38_008887 [Prunus dulcis]|uniref:Integrase catalytic domain-containing protein n=1 Tax=Prunus dulcis TaxID=3755 RepID=A0AAD4ZXD2_PRUDU|nr:hypothetical protein L3X38_008887 [Prunus dulcis]
MNAKQIRIHSDSQLIVNQVTADFAAKDASMYAYLSTAHQLLRSFQAYEIKQIPRGENSHADALARLASAINDKVERKVPVEILAQPSTITSETCAVRYEDTWMSPIYSYLTNGTLPEDKPQARKLRYRSARYTVINDVLYKRGYTTPYLKCLTAEQGDYVLREVHNGVCGDHSGSRSLAYKVFRQGYFWPTMHQDANTLVKKCDKCQRFGNIPHIPAEPLTPIVSPWPFAQWGLDLIGPMPQGKGQVKYAVVAVDYFTKWVEAEPLATITAARIEEFVWTHICCRFGIPYAIITDNGRQFDSELFRQFCTRLKINLFFASPAHPQSNGQVEAINKIVKKLLKRQLDKAKGAWPKKLPEALWAIRTASMNPQDETKFPSEEPWEENLGDYCLYHILTTNDHLTRGEKRQLDITGPSAGTLPKGIHLDAFALGHVSCSQSAPTVPHRKFQNKHTSQGLYKETPIPKEGGQKKPTELDLPKTNSLPKTQYH